MIDRIESVFRVHEQLCAHAASLQVTIENARIVVRGELPSVDLKAELIPAVRRAGVLRQVWDCVDVAN
jgi:hypothetical protein